jgi:hypothetical protein
VHDFPAEHRLKVLADLERKVYERASRDASFEYSNELAKGGGGMSWDEVRRRHEYQASREIRDLQKLYGGIEPAGPDAWKCTRCGMSKDNIDYAGHLQAQWRGRNAQ